MNRRRSAAVQGFPAGRSRSGSRKRTGVHIDLHEFALALAGGTALLAAWLPVYTTRRPLSLPMVLVIVGAVVFLIPLGFQDPDPRDHIAFVERLTELGVILALMGAGLKIDRPFDRPRPRLRRSGRRAHCRRL